MIIKSTFVNDSGQYECRAKNKLARQPIRKFTRIDVLPKAPDNTSKYDSTFDVKILFFTHEKKKKWNVKKNCNAFKWFVSSFHFQEIVAGITQVQHVQSLEMHFAWMAAHVFSGCRSANQLASKSIFVYSSMIYEFYTGNECMCVTWLGRLFTNWNNPQNFLVFKFISNCNVQLSVLRAVAQSMS